MPFYTPLRYPGGKGRLSQFMGKVVEQNAISDGHYVEPYAGGAGVAISLLFSEHVQFIHLNDIDRSIYAFWYSVLNHTNELSELIFNAKLTVDEWNKQREVQSDINASLLKLGFSTFFLNRVNRSGIISGGIIGGKKQTGKWKIDARFNKEDLIERIKRISRYKTRINLYNLDAEKFIIDIIPKIPSCGLVYLDPPYYIKGKELYENHYTHQDHCNIASLVKSRIRQKWIVSYDNVDEIRKMYLPCRWQTFSLNYSAGNKYTGTEVMFFCDAISIPEIRPNRSCAA